MKQYNSNLLSFTQQINHVTYLVAINKLKLYDTTVTCLAQFPDSTSYHPTVLYIEFDYELC